MTFEPGVQKFCRVGREQRAHTLPLPPPQLSEIQNMPSINRVNFVIVHIFSQAVLERSNYRVTQKDRNPNFKPEYLVTQAELSIGFISIERFWNSLINSIC